LYTKWLQDTAECLRERAVDLIIALRQYDIYFKETFCKMSQGLASNRAWREAESTRQAFDNEFTDIIEWARRIKPGWEKTIVNQCGNLANQRQGRQLEAQQNAEIAARNELDNATRQRLEAKILATKKRKEGTAGSLTLEAAKAAEQELLSEEEKKVTASKRKGKSN
jgi:hypothetical protein